MTNSISEEIERGWRLLNEGKEEEALQLVDELKKGKTLLQRSYLNTKSLKGS